MSATACLPQLPTFHCNGTPAFKLCELQPKGDLQHTPRKKFINVAHNTLRVVNRPGSPQPLNKQEKDIHVHVFDGSTGKRVPLIIKSTDTIGKLKEAMEKEIPHMRGSLNLAFNGKSIPSEMTMCELNVKPGATFVTYQRCIGG